MDAFQIMFLCLEFIDMICYVLREIYTYILLMQIAFFQPGLKRAVFSVYRLILAEIYTYI